MSEPLGTYIRDHLAGARLALETLSVMRDQHDDERFRNLAAALFPEIEADDATLHKISESIASGPSMVKQAGGWLLEKAARLKLGHSGSVSFELFESLELLALGIQGKLSLWKALQVAAAQDARLRGYDFDELMRRAVAQHGQVEEERLRLAETVFVPNLMGHRAETNSTARNS